MWERLPDVSPTSLVLQTSSHAAFYRKGGNSCLSFGKDAFLYLSRHHYTSELYKDLGGSGNLVETFHSGAAWFLSAGSFRPEVLVPRLSCHGLPGLLVSHSLRGALQWPHSPGKQEQVSLHLFFEELESGCQRNKMCFSPLHSRKHFQIVGWRSKWSLRRGLGVLSHLRVCERFTASIFNALEACIVPDTVSENLRRKLKNTQIHAQHPATDTRGIDVGEPSKHAPFPHLDGTCNTEAIYL